MTVNSLPRLSANPLPDQAPGMRESHDEPGGTASTQRVDMPVVMIGHWSE